MKFKYGDKVKIINNEFYKNKKGVVVKQNKTYSNLGKELIVYTVKLQFGELIDFISNDLKTVK